ncbi:MAG: hypothetical protein EB015_16555 [Methylocystaceae bacterium]|jgi:hypothetical protein|nr:hypothetical protein [Methylocystaceae bacterium]
MNARILSIAVVLISLLFAGCAKNNVPNCNSDEAKTTLLRLLEESIMGSVKKLRFGIEPTFKFRLTTNIDLLNTVNDKEKNSKSCQATITYSYPAELEDSKSTQISVNYEIIKNETDKGGFYLRAAGFEPGAVAMMQNIAATKIEQKILKTIDPPLNVDDSIAAVKDALLQKGFVEDASQSKTSNCGEFGNDCKHVFKNDKYFITIKTIVVVGEKYRGEKLLAGEIVSSWDAGDAQ